MAREEIARTDWVDFLELLTKEHEGSYVTMEILTKDFGDQHEAEHLPFVYTSSTTTRTTSSSWQSAAVTAGTRSCCVTSSLIRRRSSSTRHARSWLTRSTSSTRTEFIP